MSRRSDSGPASVLRTEVAQVDGGTGHLAIDSSGMLHGYTGEPAEKVGDTFVIHMDRESLNDFPLGNTT